MAIERLDWPNGSVLCDVAALSVSPDFSSRSRDAAALEESLLKVSRGLAYPALNDYLTRAETFNKECWIMWMTREEVAAALGIVPNSVRGKVQKGHIERKVEDGKNLYRIKDPETLERIAAQEAHRETLAAPVPEVKKPAVDRSGVFNPKQVLLEQLVSMNVGRSIDAIEKGDEIDLATGEISRDLDARISMRKHRQIKEIEDALDRLRHGEYGTCEECGEPIPEQRLRLFPAARLCVRCQEEYDQYEKMKEDQTLRTGTWREDSSEGGYARSFED